jgi:hypothetical protein
VLIPGSIFKNIRVICRNGRGDGIIVVMKVFRMDVVMGEELSRKSGDISTSAEYPMVTGPGGIFVRA